MRMLDGDKGDSMSSMSEDRVLADRTFSIVAVLLLILTAIIIIEICYLPGSSSPKITSMVFPISDEWGNSYRDVIVFKVESIPGHAETPMCTINVTGSVPLAYRVKDNLIFVVPELGHDHVTVRITFNCGNYRYTYTKTVSIG